MTKSIDAGALHIAYEEFGDEGGWPVVLSHGFPYDAHSYDEVAQILAEKGARVIAPYVRGYGPTRFLSADTPRSGQQAAVAADVLDLMDALAIPKAILGGFDWGQRAAGIAAIMAPDRVSGLVLVGGYGVQNIAKSATPSAPETEMRYWYQYYFHTARGRAGLEKNRHDFCRLLWKLWSPTWARRDAAYEQTAPSFDNPDFVDVVIHSYRHRYGNTPGDPRFDAWEEKLAAQPPITVPAISLFGDDDGVNPPSPKTKEKQVPHFTASHEERVLLGVGHNLPQEAPRDFAEAVLALRVS